jgi:hypothetical protein
MRTWVGPALVALAITACGGRTSDPPTQGPVAPGQDCAEPGATSPADDGCNTCTCEDGSWSCTVSTCPPPDPGGECDEPGATMPAGDGCNSCFCEGGTWSCTEKDCAAACEEGSFKLAGDHCNTCSCEAGVWVCTDLSCSTASCGGISSGHCDEDEYCAYNATTFDCRAADASAICRERPTECTEEDAPVCGCDGKTYANACTAAMLGDWGVMHDGACECEEGEVMGDDCMSCTCSFDSWQCDDLCVTHCSSDTVKSAGDGCNTCTCVDDEWLCTELACPEPACPVPDGSPEPPCTGDTLFGRAEGTDACCELCGTYPGYRYYESLEACEASKICSYGDARLANNGCDSCGCTESGEWFCGVSTCEPTLCGPAGDICWEDEYCAYEAGTEGCVEGAEGASCQPRPTECTDEEALVCACDGLTHSNACMAAMAGFGVLSDGPCQ